MVIERTITLSEPSEWNRFLKDIPHSFAHTWESCHAIYLTHVYKTYLFTFSDGDTRIACPICERDYMGHKDIFTPFGFPGFVGNGTYPDFHKYWYLFTKKMQYVCGYIAINPLLYDYSYFNQEEVYKYNKLFVLDLTLTIDQLYSNLSLNRKRQLRNYSEDKKNIILDKDALVEFFLNNYLEFVRAKGTNRLYEFNTDTLSAIVKLENVLMIGIKEKEKVVAVSVFAYTPYQGDFLFNVSIDEGHKYSTLLIWYAVNCFKCLNVPCLNLGGGGNEADSLADFKRRFGPKVFPLAALRQVYDENIFVKLSQNACVNPDDRSGFFPPYHSGL